MRVDLRVDETYIPDVNQRLTVYRRIAAVRNDADLDRIMDEVRDRYGPPPDSVLNLARVLPYWRESLKVGMKTSKFDVLRGR